VGQSNLDQIVLKLLHEALTKPRAGAAAMLDRQTDIHRGLSLIESYEKNLVDAIAKGQSMDPLLAKLNAEEAEEGSGSRT
jgi:hypothetical protein